MRKPKVIAITVPQIRAALDRAKNRIQHTMLIEVLLSTQAPRIRVDTLTDGQIRVLRATGVPI